MSQPKWKQIQDHVKGQRIVKVELNRRWDDIGKDWYYDPTIILENGVRLRFYVQETQIMEYGISMMVFNQPKEEPKR